ncbi:MAG: hypothetical protein IJO60_02870 [Agathobacter sp.]|nr:hypothetical protein [Agathobacter sp.]
MIQSIESENINSNDVIIDLRRVAQKLNSNTLSSSEYIGNGGKYSLGIFDDDFGSFSNYCELAGLKYKTK